MVKFSVVAIILCVSARLLPADTYFDSYLSDAENLLLTAADSGKTTQVQELIRQRVDVNVRDDSGATPLLYAVANGHAAVAAMLIAAGADVNVQNKNGDTPLMLALKNGQSPQCSQCIDTLLKAHADVNMQNAEGMTALMLAAIAGNDLIAQKLIYAGANIGMKNKKGESAYTLALHYKHAAVAEFIGDIVSAKEKK